MKRILSLARLSSLAFVLVLSTVAALPVQAADTQSTDRPAASVTTEGAGPVTPYGYGPGGYPMGPGGTYGYGGYGMNPGMMYGGGYGMGPGMMYGGYGNGYGGGMGSLGGGLWMILVWGIPILLLVLAGKYLFGRFGSGQHTLPAGKNALDILKELYARGEIEREEFLRKRNDLLEK